METRTCAFVVCTLSTLALLILLPLVAHAELAAADDVTSAAGEATAQSGDALTVAQAMIRGRRLSSDDADIDCGCTEQEKEKLTCMEKYRMRCNTCAYKSERCRSRADCDDDNAICDVAEDTCGKKAYMLYEKCKNGKWTCKNWCDYNKIKCIENNRYSANTCHERSEYCYTQCDCEDAPKKSPPPPPPPPKVEKSDDDDDDDDDDEHHHHHHHDDEEN